MTILYISEFGALGTDKTGRAMPVVTTPSLAEQAISFSAVANSSAAFNAATQFVRVQADAVCSISFGSAPTATVVMLRLAANTTEYFAVASNANKISVIANT